MMNAFLENIWTVDLNVLSVTGKWLYSWQVFGAYNYLKLLFFLLFFFLYNIIYYNIVCLNSTTWLYGTKLLWVINVLRIIHFGMIQWYIGITSSLTSRGRDVRMVVFALQTCNMQHSKFTFSKIHLYCYF